MSRNCPEVASVGARPSVVAALAHLKRTYERLHRNDLRTSLDGHWINEAFVVRLYAVLEAHNVLGNGKDIDFLLDGAERVNMCRLLRNKIAHSTATLRPGKVDKLDREIKRGFGLGGQESKLPNKYILSKDTVLRPMYDACLAYAQQVLNKEHAA